MTVQQGMDSARVRQVAGDLETQVNKINDILASGRASADVLQANWGGDDGQQLLVRWRTDAAKQLGAAGEMLRDRARELRRQADDQDSSSGEGGGGSGNGGPGGPGGSGSPGGPGGPRGTGVEASRQPLESGYDILDRGPDSAGVRTNTDDHGNRHHYDPLTGRTWQEDEEGRWRNSQDRWGNETESSIETTDHGGGWESEHESTRGTEGRGEWGESWSTERSFDNEVGDNAQAVLDNVSSEPIVEQGLWDVGASDSVASGQVGDDQVGASGEFLSYDAQTDGAMGIDPVRGGYIEANAEAGAYLLRGEAHWANEHGTAAQGEGYIGAEAEANAGAQLGPAGARVEAGFDAFAGGRIEGGVSQDLGPADVGVSGSLSYGIGAHADASAEVSMERVGVSVDIGATLGIGGSLSFDVSISPNEVLDGLEDVGEALADSPINPGNWW